MARKAHPKKDVERAIQYAESNDWRVEVGGSHAWGKLYCPYNDGDCRCGLFCIASVWSTPRNAVSHARDLMRVVDHCRIHRERATAAAAAAQQRQGEHDGI